MTQKKQLVKSNKKINRDKAFEIITDVIIFLIVVLIFGFALLAFFPGFVTSDNVDQLNQAFTNNYNPGHPIIHSIIIGSLTKLAGASGIWVVGVVQIILFALIWTYCCKTTRKYNNSEIINFLQIGLTLVISIIPINFMYSIILWKDILYTYSILLLLPLIYVGIKEKYNYNIIQIILISLSCVGIMKLRKNGLPIGFIMFVILMILTIVKTKSLKKIATFLISFILIFMCFTIPEKVVKSNSSKGGKVLDSTKLYCLATLIDKGVEIDNEDYEFLNQLIDVEKMKANYDDFSGNGIFWGSDLDNSFLTDEENSKKFSEIFYKYAMKNKELVIKHFGKLNSIWWSIKEYGPMNTIVTDNAYLGITEYENHSLYQKLKDKLNTYIFKTQGNNILYYLMYRPATMLYLSIILVVAIIIKQRKTDEKGYILLTFPMILNIGTYIILITSQDLRYFYPTHITAYFLIIVFLSTFINKKKQERVYQKSKNNKSKISVILPVYNGEKFLKRCIDSILNQTYKNIEIIAINDGSKDKSKEILDEYEKRFPKIIKHIEQKNMGVAETRNKGIELATGDYITFVDNDDFLDNDCLDILLGEAQTKDYDATISGYRRSNSKGKIIRTMKLEENCEWSKYTEMVPWARIFKKDYLIDKDIKFLKSDIGEDIYFNLQAMLKSDKINILSYIGYNWFYNDESVSNTVQRKAGKIKVIDFLDKCYNMLQKEKLLETNKDNLQTHFTRYIIWFLLYSNKGIKYKELSKEYDELFDWLKERYPKYKRNKMIGFTKPYGETLWIRLVMKIFMILHKLHLAKIAVYVYSKI